MSSTIEALETMLSAMHKMALVAPLVSEASVEFSKAMKVYAKAFEGRRQSSPVPGGSGGSDGHRENARHGCFSHASVFWEQISGMQSFIAETMRRDYKQLNRQVQSYFDLHSSEEKSSDTLIAEYALMLSRVGEFATDRFPVDFRNSLELSHEPGGWRDARSKEEAASHHKKLSLPDGACPVSGFTRDQYPPSIDPPAIYPGPLRIRRGLAPPPFKLNNPHHQVLFDELLDKLQRPSSELNSALSEIESAFLSRVAVGLTSKGFQSLRGAFRNTDEWKGIEGLKYYANELNIDYNSARSDISSIPSPPRRIEGSEDLHSNAQQHKDLAWKRRANDVQANFPHDMSAPEPSHSTNRVRRYSAGVKSQYYHTESSASSSPKSVVPRSSSSHSADDSLGPHGGNHGSGFAPTGNNQGQPPSTPKGQGARGISNHNIPSSSNEHRGQYSNSEKDRKGQRSNLPAERVDNLTNGTPEAQSGEQEIPLSKPASPICSGPDSNGSGNGKQSLSTPPTSSGSLPVQPPDRPKKLQVAKSEKPRVTFALDDTESDAKSGGSMEGAYNGSGGRNRRRLGWQHSLHNIKEQLEEEEESPGPTPRVDEGSEKRNTNEAVDNGGNVAVATIKRLPANRVHHIRRSGGFEILPCGKLIQYGPWGDHYFVPKPADPMPKIHMPSNKPRSTRELERLASRCKSRYISSMWDDGFNGCFDC